MSSVLREQLSIHRDVVYQLFRQYVRLDKMFLLRSNLLDQFDLFCKEEYARDIANSHFASVIRAGQEAALQAPWFYLAVRPRTGRWYYLRFHVENVDVEEVTVSDFLEFKERIVAGYSSSDNWPLEIDLQPFNRGFPRLKETSSIGHGVEFLNRRLSSELFQDLDNRRLLDFLRVHQVRGEQLMLNHRIKDVTELRRAARIAEEYLDTQPAEISWAEVADRMQELGFEPGWGKNARRMRDTFGILLDILEAPDPSNLEAFLARIPMIFSIVILSPHGYFGQSNVLGLPDTGGQVVYILDQARALEQEMRTRLEEQGIDLEPEILVITRLIPSAQGTTCDQPVEPITGTKNAKILRVPFRDKAGEIIPEWISRFEVWPYLERFADEVEKEILATLGRPPALIIGNYSDGNLVASLLSRKLHVTQCNIAHALEKTKYLLSDLYWKDNEEQYHFSCQFTADLIAMNTADFIITNTCQEIAGTHESVGQYESYSAFTMPGLYRVVNGVDVFDPRFNVVSPGADPDVYFPFTQEPKRLQAVRQELDEMVFGDGSGSPFRGWFADKQKPLIFTMARLDVIKNLTGLVDWYGRNPRLRELANLLVVGGHLDPDLSTDQEEREQICLMHKLIDEHNLDGLVRWVGFQTERNLVGELYRFVADTRGIFVQPALFEAYGLTVIEAMSSALPTFATCYGGPSEIIVDKVSGFHINPNHGDAVAELIVEFFERCNERSEYWNEMSRNAVDRIESRYTWKKYGQRVMTLARVYGFWKYVTNLEHAETRRYLEMFYGLQYRPRAEKIGR